MTTREIIAMTELSAKCVPSLMQTTQRLSRPRVSGITIDGASSQDLDDAILVLTQEDGILCQVHITDVDAAVPQGSAIDQNSAQRIETLYRARYNLPMLPRSLSDEQCSLKPGQLRSTVTVSWTLARDGSIATSPHIFLSTFVSQKRWSYPEFDQALAAGNAQCQLLRLVAEHLYRLRGGEDAALGRQLEGLGYLDEEGILISQPFHSQMIVAEFAIAANLFVAEFARRHQIPLLFRNQSASDEQLQSPLVQQLLAIGEPGELRRCLGMGLHPAKYEPTCRGHFGLALDAYCHFTSPIRRYVDLLNHRLVKAELLGRTAPYSAEELERQAQRINQWRETLRSNVHEHFKKKAQEKTEQHLTASQDLSKLSPKEFTRALIAACKAGKLEMLAEEIRQRCIQETLRLIDMRWVLLRGALPEAQAQILAQLSGTDAISIITMKQEDEVWESVRWQFESTDHGWMAMALCTVKDQEMATPPVLSSNKQEAKGKAAKALLEAWVYESLIPLEDAEALVPVLPREETTTPEVVVPSPSAQGEAVNYIGELNTMAQKQGEAMPEYEIVANGQNSFCATVMWQGLSYQAEGSNKKRAKAAAAQQLWQAVQLELSSS